MKLSEAIRLGAMMKPQKHGPPDGRMVLKHQLSTCALAAAAEASGFSELNVFQHEWQSAYGGLCDRVATCPVHGCQKRRKDQPWDTGTVIVHLNDHHHWTREQIADWVESQEALGAPEAVDAVGQRRCEPHLSTRA